MARRGRKSANPAAPGWMPGWMTGQPCLPLDMSEYPLGAPVMPAPQVTATVNPKERKPMSKEAEAFAEQHGGVWMDHPVYGRVDWRYDVNENNTSLSYWDWVLAQIEIEGT